LCHSFAYIVASFCLFALGRRESLPVFFGTSRISPNSFLERLTKPFDVHPADERAGKSKERLMNICSSLIADAQSPETIKPSKSSLNDSNAIDRVSDVDSTL
jgi:hypothetical protein